MTEEKNESSGFRYHEKLPFLRKRCPNLNEEELNEAEELFLWYVEFALEIYDEKIREGEPLLTPEDEQIYLEDMERLKNNMKENFDSPRGSSHS